MPMPAVKTIPLHFEKRTKRRNVLCVHCVSQIHIVKKSQIVYLRASGNYCEIHTEDGESILSSRTLKYYADQLNGQDFFRCHQSFVVNIDFIEILHKGDNASIELFDGSRLPIARRNQKGLLEAFG